MPIFFGIPEGIQEGQVFKDRQSLIDANLHRSTMAGIDGNGVDGAAAIVLSGGYQDDEDSGDKIIYTGHGGNDIATGAQVADQSWLSHGNSGLVVSKIRNLPVRVIRGYKHNSPLSPNKGYKFGGLYLVVDNWEDKGISGFIICRFKLLKLDVLLEKPAAIVKKGVLVLLENSEKKATWYSIGVEPPRDEKKLSIEKSFAKHVLDKKIGDVINFGNGFTVLDIKKYMSI
tara:strand:+ start:17 stop:703 length:687 start_codon:yes stop_codon:yes gene_type:complete